MMDIYALITAIAFIVLYIIITFIFSKEPELSKSIHSFLAGISAESASKIFYMSYINFNNTHFFGGLINEKVYIFLGAIAIFWISISSMYKLYMEVNS